MTDFTIYTVDLDTQRPNPADNTKVLRGDPPRTAFSKYNDLLLALQGNMLHVSNEAPNPTAPFMKWFDTSVSPPVERYRNATNTAWLLDNPLATTVSDGWMSKEDKIKLDGVQSVLDSKVDKVAGKQLSTEDFTSDEKVKLSGIAAGATVNSTDEDLRDRATHTGTQAISTVTDLQTALDSKVDKAADQRLLTDVEGTKLAGIAEQATKNATDAALRDRSTHTGTQSASTIANFVAEVHAAIPNAIQTNVDLKTIKYTGFYPVFYPLDAPQGYIGFLEVFIHNPDWVVQKYHDCGQPALSWRRNFYSGNTWSPWILETNSSNAVGSIATGSIIESGSNANGEYVKFADGTLICQKVVPNQVVTTVPVGGFLPPVEHPFPHEFIVPPWTSAAGTSGSNSANSLISVLVQAEYNGVYGWLTGFHVLSGELGRITKKFIAVGRWK